jgi:alpha-D-ribose 1-methylphosphonate 5-triphosphate diphosphatase PhnM
MDGLLARHLTDPVRVHRGGEVPVVRQVWRGGERVF